MSDQGTQELFQGTQGSSDKGTEGKPATTNGDTTQGALATLVGEGRKYKTIEDLAKAYLNADEHIEVLKNDNVKLKEEAAKGKTLDQVLERIEQSKKPAVDTTTEKGASALSAEQIERLVDERLTGRETARTRDENRRKAEAGLIEKLGDRAAELFAQKANTPEKRKALNALAAVDPDMFVSLFSTQAVVGNPADGTNRGSEQIKPAATGRAADPNCKEFYDVMRKKEPAKYYSQAMQLEMHKKMTADPNKFLGRKVV